MSSPTNGGWSEYQRLVLAELERLTRQQGNIEQRMQQIDRQLYAMTERDIAELKLRTTGQEQRLALLEKSGVSEDAVKKYRNWIVGIIFTVIVALLIPVVSILIGALN